MRKPATFQGKKISNKKSKPSFWRKHPWFIASVALGLLSIPLSSLVSSFPSLVGHYSPLRVATLLWHRLQWAVFTEGKNRLQTNDIYNITSFDSSSPPPDNSHIKFMAWNISLIDQIVAEGNDVTQSFFISNIASAGDPVITHRGVAAEWGLCTWDMAKQIAEGRDVILEGVRWQTEPQHMLSREREKGGMLGSAKSDAGLVSSVERSLSEFLEALFDPGSYMSWQGEVSLLNQVLDFAPTTHTLRSTADVVEGATYERVLDWTFLQVVEDDLLDAYEEELLSKGDDSGGHQWRSFVSLSHPGVVWQAAYISQHQFLSQVQGSSSITLFPPEEPMYLYPDIHRFYRQSQLPLDTLSSVSGNSSHLRDVLNSLGYGQEAEAILAGRELENPLDEDDAFPGLPSGTSVTLVPGDTLYIPPYWHVRSQANTLSITLAVNSPTATEVYLSEVYAKPTPLNLFAEHSDEGRRFASKLFLGLLLSEVSGSIPELPSDLRTFAHRIYNERYRALYPPHFLDSLRNDTLNPKGLESFSFCPGFPSESSELGMLLEKHRDGMYSSVKRVAALFVKARKAYLHNQVHVNPPDTQENHDSDREEARSGVVSARAAAVVSRALGDYLEKVARFAVGPQKTVYFLHDCLN